MCTIDIAHVASLLEELVRSLEKEQEDEVVIVENGRLSTIAANKNQ